MDRWRAGEVTMRVMSGDRVVVREVSEVRRLAGVRHDKTDSGTSSVGETGRHCAAA